jgi:hypothetical protein
VSVFAGTPDSNLWALCDGSATTYLTGIGTATLAATSFTTPNVGTDTFLKSGAYTGSVDAQVDTAMAAVGVSGGAGNMDIFSVDIADTGSGTLAISAVSTFGHTPQVATQFSPKSLAASLYFRR